MTWPDFSIVVPTWDGSERLRQNLAALVAQDHRPLEVILADDGSSAPHLDTLRAITAEFSNVRVVTGPHGGINVARNRGAAQAKGSIVVFTDDDCAVPPSWLAELAEGWRRHPDAACLGGSVRVTVEGPSPRHCDGESLGEAENEFAYCVCGLDHSYYDGGILGASMSVSREWWERCGRFDESLPLYGDEVEFLYRIYNMGGTIILWPTTPVRNRRTAADVQPRNLIRKNLRYGWNTVAGTAAPGTVLQSICRAAADVGIAARSTTHAVRRRCYVGVFSASRHLGRAGACLYFRRR